jgi:hypothetical protein
VTREELRIKNEERGVFVDWQSWTALGIALLAGVWAGWKILWPLINAFRNKKAEGGGCCGCGDKPTLGACGKASDELHGTKKKVMSDEC